MTKEYFNIVYLVFFFFGNFCRAGIYVLMGTFSSNSICPRAKNHMWFFGLLNNIGYSSSYGSI